MRHDDADIVRGVVTGERDMHRYLDCHTPDDLGNFCSSIMRKDRHVRSKDALDEAARLSVGWDLWNHGEQEKYKRLKVWADKGASESFLLEMERRTRDAREMKEREKLLKALEAERLTDRFWGLVFVALRGPVRFSVGVALSGEFKVTFNDGNSRVIEYSVVNELEGEGYLVTKGGYCRPTVKSWRWYQDAVETSLDCLSRLLGYRPNLSDSDMAALFEAAKNNCYGEPWDGF